METGNKVIVIGCPGSGKSVFSRKLSDLTGLPLYHLDNLWWKEDKTHIPREEFDLLLHELLKKDRWIIDGDYHRTYEVRMASCDTIVFLDYDELSCLQGIQKRIGKKREDIPWVEDHLDSELVELVKNYREKRRPYVYDLLDKYKDKKIVILKSYEEADAWLNKERERYETVY